MNRKKYLNQINKSSFNSCVNFQLSLYSYIGNGTAYWSLHGTCNYEERCERSDVQSLKRIPWNTSTYLAGRYPEPFLHGDMYVKVTLKEILFFI